MDPLASRDKTLEFLKVNGPCLPTEVAKHIGSSILIASAVLSELASKGHIKISKLKIGGSPLYYVSGQEEKLASMLYPRLNEKDKKTFDLLRSKRLLKNDELDPLTRVSLANLKDFAVPVSVNVDGNKVLFWKWFLLSDDELKSILDNYFKPKNKIPQKEESQASSGETSSVSKLDYQKKVDNFLEKSVEQDKRGVSVDKNSFQDFSSDSKLLESAVSFLKKNNCEVVSVEKLSKHEFNLLVNYNSPFGVVKFLCAVWDKKRFSDSDISKIFLKAYLLKVQPMLFTRGELTKKAKSLNSTLNVVVKRL